MNSAQPLNDQGETQVRVYLAAIFEHVLRDEDNNPTFYRFVDGYTVRVDRAEGLFKPLGTFAIGLYGFPENTTFDSVELAFEVLGEDHLRRPIGLEVKGGQALLLPKLDGIVLPLTNLYRIKVWHQTRLLVDLPVPVSLVYPQPRGSGPGH